MGWPFFHFGTSRLQIVTSIYSGRMRLQNYGNFMAICS